MIVARHDHPVAHTPENLSSPAAPAVVAPECQTTPPPEQPEDALLTGPLTAAATSFRAQASMGLPEPIAQQVRSHGDLGDVFGVHPKIARPMAASVALSAGIIAVQCMALRAADAMSKEPCTPRPYWLSAHLYGLVVGNIIGLADFHNSPSRAPRNVNRATLVTISMTIAAWALMGMVLSLPQKRNAEAAGEETDVCSWQRAAVNPIWVVVGAAACLRLAYHHSAWARTRIARVMNAMKAEHSEELRRNPSAV